ncbi:MAG: histidine phosphatase family protein [Acidobacteria bacterium]|nr:histidine phosphatase family protein [Acidobacteriota bacterium]
MPLQSPGISASLLLAREEALRYLLLVKHSLPQVEPAVTPPQWRLSAVGRERGAAFAQAVASLQPSVIVTRREAKAVETAPLVAEALTLPLTRGVGVQEQERSHRPFLAAAAFQVAMAHLFTPPPAWGWGPEPAAPAPTRFTRAGRSRLAQSPDEPVVVSAHGTVSALCVAGVRGEIRLRGGSVEAGRHWSS